MVWSFEKYQILKLGVFQARDKVASEQGPTLLSHIGYCIIFYVKWYKSRLPHKSIFVEYNSLDPFFPSSFLFFLLCKKFPILKTLFQSCEAMIKFCFSSLFCSWRFKTYGLRACM